MIASRGAGTIPLMLTLVLLIFGGCDSRGDSSSSPGVSIEPDREQYTLDPEAQVEFIVANPSERTLYLPVCGPDLSFVVERRENGAWKNHGGNLICPAIYPMGYRRAVEPGMSFRITTQIEEAGRYRARLSYKTSPDAEEPKVVRSEAFSVKERP